MRQVYDSLDFTVILGIKSNELALVRILEKPGKLDAAFALVFAFRTRHLRKEHFVGLPHQVAAAVGQLGLALLHLVPGTAQRVIREELDDVARGEELVADGQLMAVSRSW